MLPYPTVNRFKITDSPSSCSGTRYILRKKPAGTIISPVAHQVDREYRVLKALGTVEGFPVPKVYTLCMDPQVIGTAFYVCCEIAFLLCSAIEGAERG
jgi:aminoglycoside phosphotransferase (APT) family kinase protein